MDEKKYIEREAAIKAISTAMGKVDRKIMRDRLMSIPAADVRPVVQGKWETVMLDHERTGCRPTAHYCSECHQITWFRTFFCPNCGADMREES